MMRRVELLPAAYVERRRQNRMVAMVVVAGLALLLLLIGWWLLLATQINGARNELADVQQQNAQLQAQIDELQEFALLEQEVVEKRTALQTVMAGDVAWPAVMSDIAMVIPGEIWLVSLQASAGQTEGAAAAPTETAVVPVSGPEAAFGRIQFTGRSLSMTGVAKWMIRLGSVEEFEAVWLNDAARADEDEVADFTNTIELNAEAASRRFLETEPQ